MFDMLASLGLAVVQFLSAILPESPFTDWLDGISLDLDGLVTGLGWLNWVLDVGGMVLVMDAWLLAVGVWLARGFGISILGGIRGAVRTIWQGFLTGDDGG